MTIVNTIAFNSTTGLQAPFTAGSAPAGFTTPEQSNVTDGKVYRYYATASDGSWESGSGVYSVSSHTLARNVTSNSNDDQNPINFLVFPVVNVFPSPPPTLEPVTPTIVLPGFLFGCTLSTAGLSVSFGVAAGQAADSTGVDTLTLGSAFTKSTSAWAVGSGNGALDTGSIAASTWYHVYLIKRPDTGVVDIAVSLSAAGPTLVTRIPTAYTEFRRIGSMFVDGSNHWLKFVQIGDEFIWDAPITDVNATALTTTSALFSLTVPTGLSTIANFIAQYTSTVVGDFYIVQSPLITTQVANTPAGNFDDYIQIINSFQGMRHRIITDASSRVRVVGRGTGTSQFSVVTTGWIDNRGRLY